MKACDKHTADPVKGYSACAGCEVEILRAEIEQLKGAARAKPLTRRDINFVKQPPGVIALAVAMGTHDSAEMELFARDDQVVWAGLTVGQLREVLVAALGLPAGTKFGG